jgi:hypothetical protein
MTAVRSLGLFAAISAGIIFHSWLVLRLIFPTDAQQQAMLLSAGLAFAVQVGAYALLAPGKSGGAMSGELMLRWGMGAVIRLVVLVIFAVLASVIRLPLDAALVSLATYFFLTMIAEPLLLNHVR